MHRIRGLEYFADAVGGMGALVRRDRGEPHLPARRCRSSARPGPTARGSPPAGAVMDTAADHDCRASSIEPNPQAQITSALGDPRPAGHLRRSSTCRSTPTRRPTTRSRSTGPSSTTSWTAWSRRGCRSRQDLDQAWRDFAGWRVNYDETLLRICALVSAPPAPWSSDRVERWSAPRAMRLGRGAPCTRPLNEIARPGPRGPGSG